ncbi:MAG: response regulator transcription factor [Coriobacteriales bacterium]|jgi:DNA-binding response OmpR family regulator|nr:response regulator transcription factor [Coriobacteriales bacterium]
MAKILLVDDDHALHKVMRETLGDLGHEMISAFNGDEGLTLVAAQRPDLLLLDVMMPGMSGFEVCERMRRDGRRIPVIFLSAKGDIVDKSIGFKIGADDYVVKPFSTDELLLRIDAHLRRHKGDLAFSKAIARNGSNRVGDLEIFFNRYEVLLKGRPIDLTAKEFEILALMMANPGQVFSRNQIADHIWGENSLSDENSITVFVRKIREKIEDNPSQPRYLLTVWRVGYKFAKEL